MKSNEKLGFYLKDENHFISLLFTLRASRRLTSSALLRPRHPAISGIASALNVLQMKASDSCKIQVINLITDLSPKRR
jgi:hypothetical protein